MTGLGISAHEISQLLSISRNTLRRVMVKYRRDGFAGVFQRNSRDVQTEKHRNSQLKAKQTLEILHQRPNSFGINRTTGPSPNIQRYMSVLTVRELARLQWAI